MSMTILLASIAVSVIGGFLALFLGRSAHAAKVVACLFGMGSALLAVLAGFQGVIGQGACLSVATPFSFADFTLLLNPIAGLLLAIINVLAFAAFLYGLSYFDEYKENGLGAMGLFMNLFIASMNVLVVADNAFWFLVFFELMSLTSYFLVVVEQKKQSIKGGFMYLVMAHVGFLMIMISYFIMASQTGSFEFAAYRVHDFGPALGSLAFVLAFFGFGCKAGMVPFHSWLPQAHPAAPSNVSALMSGGMIKIGVFGIIKVGLDLLSGTDCMLWWGLLVLVVGAVSSVLGVVYALGEHDIKKLLAYHSVENIGIVALFLGFGGPLGIAAALLHCVTHGLTKSFLFCLSGNVLMKYGTRDLNEISGVLKAMPATGVLLAMGFFALAGFPPFAMFVSEITGITAGVMDGRWIVLAIFVIALTIVVAACAHVVTAAVFGKVPDHIKKGDVGVAALVPEIILAVTLLWFGVAAPQPMLQCVEDATGIVTQSSTEALHETPVVNILFSQTDGASAGMKVER